MNLKELKEKHPSFLYQETFLEDDEWKFFVDNENAINVTLTLQQNTSIDELLSDDNFISFLNEKFEGK